MSPPTLLECLFSFARDRSPVSPWICAGRRTVSPVKARRHSGFTLVEMLVVVAIMLMMIGILVPSIAGLKGAQDVTSTGYDIAGALERARSYAMVNNTYVWVGFAEVDASKDPGAVPQADGAGRVAVSIVASRDGTRHYAVTTSNQGSDWQAGYAQPSSPEYRGRHLIAVSKLQRFDDTHLAATLGTVPGSGNMARPAVAPSYLLGDDSCQSATPFTYPLGSDLDSNYQYRFDKVIEFTPEGVARIVLKNTGGKIVQWIEIALQHTHGNVVPPAPVHSETGNNIALQVEGMTGAIRIYRP